MFKLLETGNKTLFEYVTQSNKETFSFKVLKKGEINYIQYLYNNKIRIFLLKQSRPKQINITLAYLSYYLLFMQHG